MILLSSFLVSRCSSPRTLGRTTAHPPLANKSAPKPAETFEEFQETVVPMLLALGPYAYTDPVLLYKILRIMKAALGIVSTRKEKGRKIGPCLTVPDWHGIVVVFCYMM